MAEASVPRRAQSMVSREAFPVASRYRQAAEAFRNQNQRPNSPQTVSQHLDRASAHIRKERWENACHAAKKAMELDPLSVQGHTFYGKALMGLSKFQEAIEVLQKALELAKQKKVCDRDISKLLREAKKKVRTEQLLQKSNENIDLQIYLNGLINEDEQRTVSKMNQFGISAAEITKASEKIRQYQNDLNEMFQVINDRSSRVEVPDYFCGKITFELMKDPVITPYGITYDRCEIYEHLEKVGFFDPTTRQPLRASQLVPNYALKDAIQAFSKEKSLDISFQ